MLTIKKLIIMINVLIVKSVLHLLCHLWNYMEVYWLHGILSRNIIIDHKLN